MLNLAVDGVIGEGAMRVEGEKEGVQRQGGREGVIHDEESSEESYSEAEGERAHAESQEMADARVRSLEIEVEHEHEMEITIQGIGVGSVGVGMDVALDDAWIGEGMLFVGDSTFSGFPVIVEQRSAAPLDGE
jgi:hypothetical protein